MRETERFNLEEQQAALCPGLREVAAPLPAPSLLLFLVFSVRRRQRPGRTLFKAVLLLD